MPWLLPSMTQPNASLPLEACHEIIKLGYDSISIHDRNGNCVYISSSVRDLLGYNAQQLIGVSGMDIVHPDDMQEAMELFSQTMKNPGKTFRGDLRLKHKNGETIAVIYRVTNLLDNPTVQGIVINFHDITDRKNIEQQLQESEEKYATLVEQGNDGIMIVQDELMKYANTKLLEMLGYTSKEFIGTHALQYIAPEYVGIAAERYMRQHLSPKTAVTSQWRSAPRWSAMKENLQSWAWYETSLSEKRQRKGRERAKKNGVQ